MDHVVIFDPNGNFWPGALVGGRRVSSLHGEGVRTLPVETSLFTRSGIGGFFMRSWGAGVRLNNPQPKMIVPMTVYVDAACNELHWMVRLMPDLTDHPADVPFEVPKRFNGLIRLSQDSQQPGTTVQGLGPSKGDIPLDDLGPLDEHGGWTVQGRSQLSPTGEGYMGVSFYGTAPGLTMVWAAITACRSEGG